MQKKFKSRWPFTKKGTSTDMQKQEQPLKPATLSYKLCRSIHDTPLYKFIEALCDGNIHALTLEGNPPEAELQASWSAIMNEYTEVLGSVEQKYYLSLLKEATRLEMTLTQIHSLIEVLRNFWAKPLADQLNKISQTNFPFDPNNPEQYDKDLTRCYNRSRGVLLALQLKKDQLEKAAAKLKGDQKPDRLYFENALITLSDHAHLHLTDRIMTSEFCTRLNRYTKFIESQPKK